jgi:hypothetical protein
MLRLPEGVSFAEADLKAIHRSQTRSGCTACIMDLTIWCALLFQIKSVEKEYGDSRAP